MTATELNRCDVTHLFNAIASNTFPKVTILGLVGNVLTDCVSILQECCELPPLKKLTLIGAELSRKDIKSLSILAEQGRLPKLKNLSLSGSAPTPMLADLFGSPDHPGFTVLEDLHFYDIHCTRDYLSVLTNVVRDNKLPALKVLFIEEGSIERYIRELHIREQHIREQYNCNVDKEMRALAQSCVTRYRYRPFKLKHSGFKLSTENRGNAKIP